MLTLSVLDQSLVRQGVTPRDVLLETVDLAKHCEALGYRRYWFAKLTMRINVDLLVSAERYRERWFGAELLPLST
jgi:hypothetical protein